MNRLFYFIFICTALLLPFAAPASHTHTAHASEAASYAAPARSRVIETGIIEQAGYASMDEDGLVRGFDAEYMYKIAQTAGLSLHYRVYQSTGELLDALERGEIDCALGIAKTAERQERFLFPRQPFMSGSTHILMKSDEARFHYDNIQEITNMHLGVVDHTVMLNQAREWSRDNHAPLTLHIFENESSMYTALEKGTIDGIIVTGKMHSQHYKAVLELSSTGYYAVFNKNKAALCNEVNSAMLQIQSIDTAYAEKLYRKYRATENTPEQALSSEEIAFLSTHPVLRIAVPADRPPFYVKTPDGGAEGIIPDYYRALASQLGCGVTFEEFRSWSGAVSALEEKKVDLIGMTEEDVVEASHNNLLLTNEYMTMNLVHITKTGTRDIQNSAILRGTAKTVHYLLGRVNPHGTYRVYGQLEDCFHALRNDEVDSIICSSAQAEWLLNQQRSTGYTVKSFDGITLSYSGAVRPSDTVLASLLTKAAQNSRRLAADIVVHNTSMPDELGVMLRHAPVEWVIFFFLFIIGLMSLAAYMFYLAKRRKNQAALDVKQAALEASERAREAESAFLSTMSHDMRTPLNGILGFTHLALKENEPSALHGFLRKIQVSGDLMLSLINDILDLSKIESGKMELSPCDFSFSELNESILTSIEVRAQELGIYLEASFDAPEGLYITGDRLRMQQVIMNILSNALKYTPRGGHVRWNTKVTLHEGTAHVLTTIEDDGIGMSKEFQSRMFDAFSQENRKDGTGAQGTGLGLSLVKRFVDLLGGKIQVESTLHQGTKFTITGDIPAFVETQPAKPQTPVESIPQDFLAGIPILLCEDNDINAEIATMILGEYGADKVERAENGEIGVSLFRTHDAGHYGVVLMDLRMPVMDGFTAAKTIRSSKHADAGSIPIYAMSADAFEEDIRKCREAGMNGHLPKPIDPAKLIGTLYEIFRK